MSSVDVGHQTRAWWDHPAGKGHFLCEQNGVGIVGIAVIAVIFHDQRLDFGAIIGMGLIIAGIIVMRLYSTMNLE